MRVLVIEDDDLLQALAVAVLGASHDVAVAGSGEDGLRMALRGGYDVILCDLEMPGGMTGLGVWERLPDHMRRSFLLWTASPGLAAGRDVRVLPKPADLDELLDAVEGAYKG